MSQIYQSYLNIQFFQFFITVSFSNYPFQVSFPQSLPTVLSDSNTAPCLSSHGTCPGDRIPVRHTTWQADYRDRADWASDGKYRGEESAVRTGIVERARQ